MYSEFSFNQKRKSIYLNGLTVSLRATEPSAYFRTPHYTSSSQHSTSIFDYYTTTKSRQSCSTLCDPIDGSPPGSTIPGILQARTLEWVAISFSNAWKWKVKVKLLSRARLLVTPWTAAYQAPLSMGFSRQEYWSSLIGESLIPHQ